MTICPAWRLPAALLVVAAIAACGDVAPPIDDQPDAGDTVAYDGGSPLAPETSITSAPAALVNQAVARFELASDPAGASFECSLDGEAATACDSPFGITVDDGEHTLAVVAVVDGVADPTPASHTWRVDTVPPDGRFVLAPPALDNSAVVTLTFTADEDASFTCAVDGAAAVPCTSPFEIDPVADGDHAVTLVATDTAGNVDPTPAVHRWNTDTSSPDTLVDSGPSGQVASTDARLVFSSPDAGPGATFECATDGAAFAPCTSPVSLSGLAQGEHRFEARAFDAIGNVDPSPAVVTWVVDTIAPTVTITAGPTGLTNDNTPTFRFTVNGAPSAIDCQVDTGNWGPCNNVYTTVRLRDGSHAFRVRARDAAGNTTLVSRSFTVDATPPSLSITSAPAKVIVNETRVTFRFSASGSAGTRCRLYRGDATPPGYSNCTSPRSYNIGYGPLVFEVQAYDAAGNTTTRRHEFDNVELI